MLSCVVALGALGVSADTAPPTISLDLDESTLTQYAQPKSGVNCAANSAFCRQRTGANAYGGGTHGYTENFSKTCPAGPRTDATSCPVPTARAYDHHDGELSVVKKIYLVNNNGVKGSTTQTFDKINYALRSEWLMTFDAEDNAGNKAQQIVFAMILDDTTAPTITPKTGSPHVLEACDKDNTGQDVASRQYWLAPNNNPAMDNYDGDLTNELKITVKAPNAAQGNTYTQNSVTPPRIELNTHVLGTWTMTYSVHDHAGMFGANGQDNSASMIGQVVVRDTIAPALYCNKQKCVFETKVRSSVNSNGFISSVATTSKEACCDLCETQQWSRVVGSNAATNPAKCSYFHFEVAKEYNCHLFSSSAMTQPLVAATGVIGGYPQQCQNENVHECAAPYTAAGAKCIDIHDSLESDGKISSTALTVTATTVAPGAAAPATGETIDNTKTGTYTVAYTCSDLSANPAVEQKRTVKVVDTITPTLKITTGVRHAADATRLGQASYTSKGNIDDLFVVQHSAGFANDVAHLQRLTTKESGFTCTDTCDGSLTNDVKVDILTGSCNGDKISLTLTATMLVQPKNYYLKYTCTDKASNTATKCRTVEVVDNTKPVITIIGEDKMTLEADAIKQYADSGAICSDQVDGLISEKIVVTGAIVKLATPNTYTIIYNCKDAQGNAAVAANRVVVVKDTKCPTCVIGGQQLITREASFPYADGGATCTDSLDGSLGPATAHSTVNVETTGTYTVSYTTTDKAGNVGCAAYVRTVVVKDTLKPVIALRYQGKLVHTSSVAGNVGLNGQANPAGVAFQQSNGLGNPHLVDSGGSGGTFMAESNSHSSLMMAAVASSVVGIALLAVAHKRSASDLTSIV